MAIQKNIKTFGFVGKIELWRRKIDDAITIDIYRKKCYNRCTKVEKLRKESILGKEYL